MRMSFSQKCVVLVLAIAIFGGSGYFAYIAFRRVELNRYKSIPWVKYVHPNVKKLKQAQDLVRKGNLTKHVQFCLKRS